MSDIDHIIEHFPDHLQPIKEDPKDNEESKHQSPFRPQSKWVLKNTASPTSLGAGKTSPLHREPIDETAELQEESDRKPRDLPAKPTNNSDFEKLLQEEREKLTLIFQQEMQDKLEELDSKLNNYWETKYDEIQKSYEDKINQYEQLLEAQQTDSQADIASTLEKEISEKYQQQYLDKIEEIQQNFKSIEEENLVQIIDEIKKELEVQYEEKYQEQIDTMRKEANNEIERHKAELDSRRGNLQENDEFQKMLGIDVKSSIESALREKYEQEKHSIIQKYTHEQEALKKEIRNMEGKMKEKIEIEVEEELKKEFNRKEKLMNLNWRKKMESYKKTLEDNFEQEMKAKLEKEKKEIERAKAEMSRMKSLENVRLKKAEDNKKGIETKLKEQEDKYEKIINGLKKQIDDLKNTSRLEDERLSHVRRETSKEVRSNSLARSAQNQPKSPMESKMMAEIQNRDKQDSFLEEGFYKPELSNSQSPYARQKTNPASPQRRDIFEDRGIDKFIPPKTTYTQPSSTLRTRAEYQRGEEPYKVVQDIIDPMAPPDLLSLEKPEPQDIFLREREVPKQQEETNKYPVLISQSGSTYDNLKAQIMKKYSPQKLEEYSPYDARVDTQGLDSNATTQRAGLFGAREETQPERESVPMNISLYERERDTEKGGDDNFQKKYEAILRKYTKESFAKDKYQSTFSERGSFKREMPTRDTHQSNQKKYQQIFEAKSDDDQKTKDMKKLKKHVTDMIEKDQTLESKYLGREIFFTTDFLTRIDIETTGQQKTLKNSLKTLYDLWNDIETSYQARLNFMDSLELIPEYDNLIKKINLEIDYLKVTQRNVGDIMGFLKKRNYYREQINFDNFEYKKYRKLYFAIDANNMDMRKLIDPYKRKYNKDVLYKGVELSDIIKVDAWENEYLQKVELKEEILEKIRKKLC